MCNKRKTRISVIELTDFKRRKGGEELVLGRAGHDRWHILSGRREYRDDALLHGRILRVDGEQRRSADGRLPQRLTGHHHLSDVEHLAGERRARHQFAVEAHAEQMRRRLLRFEVDPEASVALRLDVVGHVAAVDGHDYLQVASASLTCVDCNCFEGEKFVFLVGVYSLLLK